MSTPTVSCIVPVFNGERHLEEALESVLAQTRPPNEILVIDDGSTDGSARLIAQYGERVRYLHKENGGPASARNLGISAAAGEFLSFIDQDDVWHREKLERQLACFAKNPRLALCFAHVERFWEPTLQAEEDGHRGQMRGGRVPGYSTPTMLARRSAFERVGYLNTRLHFADATDWTLRAMDGGLEIRLLPETLLYHRMHASNLTRQREASKSEFVRVVKATIDRRRESQRSGGRP